MACNHGKEQYSTAYMTDFSETIQCPYHIVLILLSLNFLTFKNYSLCIYMWFYHAKYDGYFPKEYVSYNHLCDPVHLFSIKIQGVLKRSLLTNDEWEWYICVLNGSPEETIRKRRNCTWAFLVTLRLESPEEKNNHLCGDCEEVNTALSVRADQVVRKCWFLERQWKQ